MTMKKSLILLALGSATALQAFSAAAADVDLGKLPPASSKKGVTFENDIKPIFEKGCFKCHGPESAKPKGKFRADTLEAIMKGGENAPNVVAGNIKKSTLLHQVALLVDEDEWMPPKDNKAKIPALTKEQVGLVRAWIEQGAK
jgi:hypothetical protein